MAARVPGIPETAISMREVMKGRRQGSTGLTQLRLTEGPVWKWPGQCKGRSEVVPTAIWSSQLMSGSAHLDLVRWGRQGKGKGEGKGRGREGEGRRKEGGRRKEAYNFYKIQRP